MYECYATQSMKCLIVLGEEDASFYVLNEEQVQLHEVIPINKF